MEGIGELARARSTHKWPGGNDNSARRVKVNLAERCSESPSRLSHRRGFYASS